MDCDDATLFGLMKIAGTFGEPVGLEKTAGYPLTPNDSSGGRLDEFGNTPYYGQALRLEGQRLKVEAQVQALEHQVSDQREAQWKQIRDLRAQLDTAENALRGEMLEWKAQQEEAKAQPLPVNPAAAAGVEEVAPGVPPVQPDELAMAEQALAAEQQQQMAEQQQMAQQQVAQPGIPG